MTETIFKKDSKGKVRFLTIQAMGDEVLQTSGILGTASPVTNISKCQPKNVGRSNATTAEEQAVLEANAKLKDKLSTGYFLTITEAENEGGADFLLPMLAHDYKKHLKKVTYPCYVQPKLDGMRALGDRQGLTSRTGKKINTLQHIDYAIASTGMEGFVLDGELYAHELSFQENMKLIKKFRIGESTKIRYHVYDLVSDLPFHERFLKLRSLVDGNPNIELVHTARINNEEELLYHHKLFVSQGYEGTMVRHGLGGYEVNKRSSSLLKYKDFMDEAYRVVDIVPSEARPEHGVIVCHSLIAGANFNCGMRFSHAEREEMLINKGKYLGQMAEVRFFEYTDSGLPRFPVCVGFRLDK